MSRYAWANPTTGVREQDDSLGSAVERIRQELKGQGDHFAVNVILYRQTPKFSVDENGYIEPVSPARRSRIIDRVWLWFHKPESPEEFEDE